MNGSALRTLRLERGFTQESLERRSGVARRTISYIECGHVSPRAPTRKKLLAALRVDWAEQRSVFGDLA